MSAAFPFHEMQKMSRRKLTCSFTCEPGLIFLTVAGLFSFCFTGKYTGRLTFICLYRGQYVVRVLTLRSLCMSPLLCRKSTASAIWRKISRHWLCSLCSGRQRWAIQSFRFSFRQSCIWMYRYTCRQEEVQNITIHVNMCSYCPLRDFP